MPVNHAASTQPCNTCSTRMSRSNAIAIMKNDPFLNEEDEREACEKSFYECATWRMYNRIVDHRLNTPLQASPIHETCNGWDSPALVGNGCSTGSPTPNAGGLIRPKPRYARAEILSVFGAPCYHDMSINDSMEPCFAAGLEDEVFELEL